MDSRPSLTRAQPRRRRRAGEKPWGERQHGPSLTFPPPFPLPAPVASRLAVLWGIVHYSPPSQTSVFFTLMSVSWSLVEVPRYSWYLTELLGLQSAPLTYLRYSLFLVLYPTGITGECGSLWQSLSYFEDNQMRLGLEVALPNAWNLVYSHRAVLLFLLFAIYPFGSYVMYNNMWVSRRKKLSPPTSSKCD
jgi:very-long-chain (3R)-3-hydroxyacyl-CoA dehydratase